MKSAHATAISLCEEALRQAFGQGYVVSGSNSLSP